MGSRVISYKESFLRVKAKIISFSWVIDPFHLLYGTEILSEYHESNHSLIFNDTVHSASMGLYVCNELCKLMNGEITVNSVKGKGSSFMMKVQVDKESQPSDSVLVKLANSIDADKKHRTVNILAIVPQFILEILREYLAFFNVNLVKLSKSALRGGQITMENALKYIGNISMIIQISKWSIHHVVKELLTARSASKSKSVEFHGCFILNFDGFKAKTEAEICENKLFIVNLYLTLIAGLEQNKILCLQWPIKKTEIIQNYVWLTYKKPEAQTNSDCMQNLNIHLVSNESTTNVCDSNSCSNDEKNCEESVCLPPAPSLASSSKHRTHLLPEAQLSTPSCTFTRLLSEEDESASNATGLSDTKQSSAVMNRESTTQSAQSANESHVPAPVTSAPRQAPDIPPRSQSELLIFESPTLSNRSVTTASYLSSKKRRPSKLLVNNPTSLYVLIVDDCHINGKVAQHLLKIGEIASEIVVSGEEAINRISNTQLKPFTHILTDIHMPDIDGIQLTKIIRVMGKEELNLQPVIIGFTASPSKDLHTKGIIAGMQGFVSKPIEIQALSDLLSINPLSLAENVITKQTTSSSSQSIQL